jgi:hypothetical protein
MVSRQDGTGWEGFSMECELPQKLKVGVIAESTADGIFRPVFDKWKLILAGGKAR